MALSRWYQIRPQGGFAYPNLTPDTGASAVLTGTSVPSITQADVIAGGKTIIITLTGDTWIAAGALSFDLIRQDIINGLVAASSPLLGWNNVVVALQSVSGVVRTSANVVTLTLDAFPTYAPGASETITDTVPASAVLLAAPITATPTFSVIASAGIVARRGWSIRVGSRAA